MAGSRASEDNANAELETEDVAETDERELYLRDGRRLVVGEHDGEQVVEIRAESGMVELRVRMTEQGPVLQVESVKLQLKAQDAVEIEAKRVSIKATEKLDVESKEDLDIKSDGDMRVVGKTINLN
jgi:hypothetical protein